MDTNSNSNKQGLLESLLPKPSEMMESDHGKATLPADMDSEGGGVLVVTIHEGNDLKGKHHTVILRVGHNIRLTKTMKNNHNPVWKETFKFTVAKPAKAVLHLLVCSSSLINKDILVAVDISVADVIKEKHINKVYNNENGRIHVELQWEASALPVKTKPKLLQILISLYNIAVS